MGPRTRFDAHAAVLLLSTRGLERPRPRARSPTTSSKAAGVLIAAGPESTAKSFRRRLGAGRTLRLCRQPMPGRAAPVRALAPADVRHPVFQAFGAAATLGLVKFQASRRRVRRRGCQTLARFTTGETGAGRVRVGERTGDRARLRSRQPLERFSAARDVRAVPARGRAVSFGLAAACARII